jgi:hypothetical protein
MAMRTLLIPVLALLFSMAGYCDTIIVPDDQPAIQDAILIAMDGDTVLVKPGTYTENINFKGKAITVKSIQGAGVTVIDGNQDQSVVTATTGEGPDSVLDGFTLTNGYAVMDGGGIWCISSSPTIKNNIIAYNYAPIFGGGMFLANSSSEIKNNAITHNDAGYFGGGICQYYCDVMISGNVIMENTAKQGGGIWIDKQCSTRVINNWIAFNESTHGWGGGIGIQQGDGIPTMFPRLINNTIMNNVNSDPQGKGGGIYCSGSIEVTVINTILWGNAAPQGKELYIEPFMGNNAALSISYSDVEGGTASIYVDPSCTLDWGMGMIHEDPLFVDAGNLDLHLTYVSPCRDAGDDSVLAVPVDFEGDPRIAYGHVDMGADEFYTHLYFMGNAAPGGEIRLIFTGNPETEPVGFWVGSALLEIPLTTTYGDWWNLWWLDLSYPFAGPIVLPPLPSNGVETLSGNLPLTPPGPYTLHFQGMIGCSLTNLARMNIE